MKESTIGTLPEAGSRQGGALCPPPAGTAAVRGGLPTDSSIGKTATGDGDQAGGSRRLRTYEFKRGVAWAGRLIGRYTRNETPTNARKTRLFSPRKGFCEGVDKWGSPAKTEIREPKEMWKIRSSKSEVRSSKSLPVWSPGASAPQSEIATGY